MQREESRIKMAGYVLAWTLFIIFVAWWLFPIAWYRAKRKTDAFVEAFTEELKKL